MSTTAVVLILLSAVLHAGWNLLSKSERPTAGFFFFANLCGCLALTPVLLLYGPALAYVPPSVWWMLGITGFFQALYFAALAGAYRHGDISLAYPLARSSPVLVVMAVAFLLGRGDQVSAQAVVGIVLVVAGSLVLPMRRFADMRLAHYLNPSCLLGLLAAVGTAGYSIIDDEALRHLRSLPAIKLEAPQIALLYALFEGISSCFWLGWAVGSSRVRRAAFVQVAHSRKKAAALAGVGMYITYPLVLIAMAYADNVSYVAAFRQVSIPLGVALGVLVLGEPRHRPKFLGTAVIFAGLVLVGTG